MFPDGFVDPVRKYQAMEFEVNKSFSKGWQMRANYRIAKLQGNYEGGFAMAAVGLFYAAAPAIAQDKKITVWWGKGFYKSEDDALLEAIKKFEAKTGIKVELSQYAIQDMIPKTVAALDSGTVPDVVSVPGVNVPTALCCLIVSTSRTSNSRLWRSRRMCSSAHRAARSCRPRT